MVSIGCFYCEQLQDVESTVVDLTSCWPCLFDVKKLDPEVQQPVSCHLRGTCTSVIVRAKLININSKYLKDREFNGSVKVERCNSMRLILLQLGK